MKPARESLRIALWLSIGGLLAAVIPIWPYGLYMLLRLIVTAVALYAIYVFGNTDPKRTVGLAAVALLFNPLVTVELPRMVWLPIDIGVAYWFWRIVNDEFTEVGADD